MGKVIEFKADLNQRLIELLEQSSLNAQEVINKLPGIFFLLDHNLKIIKFNDNFLKVLDETEPEQVFTQEINEFLTQSELSNFKSTIDKMGSNLNRDHQVQIKISGQQTDLLGRKIKQNNQYFYIFMGTSKKIEKFPSISLDELYEVLPISIFTMNEDGIIEKSFSSHISSILKIEKIEGKNFFDIFFQENWSKLPNEEKEKINYLHSCFNRDRFWFEAIQDDLPTIIKYVDEKRRLKKYFSLKVSPYYKNELINKLVLTLEDETKRIREEKETRDKSRAHEVNVDRILQVKRNSAKNLHILFNEFTKAFSKLDQALGTQDMNEVKANLHSIKGNAFVAGFSFLAEKADLTEEVIERRGSWNEIKTECLKVKEEFDELKPLIKAMSPQDQGDIGELDLMKSLWKKYNEILLRPQSLFNQIEAEKYALNLTSLNTFKAEEFRPLIEEQVRKLSEQTGKSVNIDFSHNEIILAEELRSILSNVILHSLNNAFIHGIEEPNQRNASGKNPEAFINISFLKSKSKYKIRIEDDGRGIDPQKIRTMIASKGLLTYEQSLSLTDHDIIQYITHSGFSTKTDQELLAGRGVGLNRNQLEQFGGAIKIESQVGRGTGIEVSIPVHQVRQQMRVSTSRSFLFKLCSVLKVTRPRKQKIEANLNQTPIERIQGLLVIDEMKVLTAISILLETNEADETKEPKISINDQNKIMIDIPIKGKRKEEEAEVVTVLEKAVEYTGTILNSHDGSLFVSADRLLISIGKTLLPKDLPKLSIVGPEDLNKIVPTRLKILLEEALEESGIKFEYVETIGNNSFSIELSNILLNHYSDNIDAQSFKRSLLNQIGELLGF